MTIPHARGAVNVDGALEAQRTQPERAGDRPTNLRARATGAAPWEPSSPRAERVRNGDEDGTTRFQFGAVQRKSSAYELELRSQRVKMRTDVFPESQARRDE